MRTILPGLFSAILFLSVRTINAQQIASTSFAEQFELFVKPFPTMKATAEAFPDFDSADKLIRESMKQLEKQIGFIYSPLLEEFKSRIAGQTAKGISIEEKSLLMGYQVAAVGLSSETELLSIRLVMLKRPTVASGKTSWTRLGNPLSASGKSLYQQLLAIEKICLFEENVEDTDSEVDALNSQMEEALQQLPVRKVKYKGEDFVMEMGDPEKAVQLIRQYEVKKQLAFQKRYDKGFKSWQKTFQYLQEAGKKLDGILQQTANGTGLTGSDQQLTRIIADVQARVLEAMHRLAAETRKVIMDGQVSEWNRKQTEYTLSQYQNYELIDR